MSSDLQIYTFSSSSEILAVKNKPSYISSAQESTSESKIERLLMEQENCDPLNQNYDIESKKIPYHLRANRLRVGTSKTSSTKSAKVNKIHTYLRNIIKQSSEKHLLHSQSFQLEKEEYPTLLKRKNTISDTQKPDIQDFNDVNFQQILSVKLGDVNFGDVFPGSVLEKELEIKNRTLTNLAIRIFVSCKNEDLSELDEYVFSITKHDKFEYNDKLLLVLPAASTVKTKLAINIPDLKSECLINGTYMIEIVGLNKTRMFNLEASMKIPKLNCLKEIFDSQNKIYVLKIALKQGKKLDFKVFIRNDNEYIIDGHFEFLDDHNQNECDLMLYPSNASIDALSNFVLNMMIKQKAMKLKENLTNFIRINKVLLFKVRNSSLIYFFALAIDLY